MIKWFKFGSRLTFRYAGRNDVLGAKVRGHRDVVTVVGHAATISAGEWITASGEWINDRTHGRQFKARFLRTRPRLRLTASRNTYLPA